MSTSDKSQEIKENNNQTGTGQIPPYTPDYSPTSLDPTLRCFLIQFDYNDEDGVYRNGQTTMIVYAVTVQHAVSKILEKYKSAFNFVDLTLF